MFLGLVVIHVPAILSAVAVILSSEDLLLPAGSQAAEQMHSAGFRSFCGVPWLMLRRANSGSFVTTIVRMTFNEFVQHHSTRSPPSLVATPPA
jgi:hypothetical protein